MAQLKHVLAIVLIAIAVWAGWPLLDHPTRALRIVLQQAPETLPVPVAGIRVRSLRDSWGAPRSGGRRHRGIDIFAPRGTAVRSTTAGIVWRVGENRLGGNVIWVLGPGWHMHYYAHLDGFATFRRGDLVAAGDLLGFVGNSGNARGGPFHLHYGIYTMAGAVNPFPFFGATQTTA